MALKKREEAMLKALAKDNPRVAAELKKLDQISARLSDSVARAEAQSRKDDTREKILVGAVMINHLCSTENGKEALIKIMNEHVKKDGDREFLKARGWRMQNNENVHETN